MSQWIKRITELGIGSKDRAQARRRSRVSNPNCDALEGRQLLSMMGGGMRVRPDFAGGQSFDQGQVQSTQGRTRLNAFGGATGGVLNAGGHGMRARRFAMRFGGGPLQQSAMQAPATPVDGTSTGAAAAASTTTAPGSSAPTAGNSAAMPQWPQGASKGSFASTDRASGYGAQGGGQGMPFGPGGSGGQGFGPGGFGGAGPMGGFGQSIDQGSTSSGAKGGHGASATTGAADTEFQKLFKDVQAIQDKSQATPALEAAVRKDFEKIQAAATGQPDQTKLQALNDLQKSLDGQLPTDDQKQQLRDAFTAVLKSQGISDQSLIDQTIADLDAVQNARNITADDLATIKADQAAIQAKLGTTDSTLPQMPLPGLILNAYSFPGGPRGGSSGR